MTRTIIPDKEKHYAYGPCTKFLPHNKRAYEAFSDGAVTCSEECSEAYARERGLEGLEAMSAPVSIWYVERRVEQ